MSQLLFVTQLKHHGLAVVVRLGSRQPERKLGEHISIHTQEAGNKVKWGEAMNCQSSPPGTYFLQQDFLLKFPRCPPNSPTNWRPIVKYLRLSETFSIQTTTLVDFLEWTIWSPVTGLHKGFATYFPNVEFLSHRKSLVFGKV